MTGLDLLARWQDPAWQDEADGWVRDALAVRGTPVTGPAGCRRGAW